MLENKVGFVIEKPELQLISETKKLRYYPDVERLTISKAIVISLLNKLGVSNKSNEQHHIEVIKLISNNKEFTPEEFEKAFNLAIEGILDIDLFQQLNCIVVGKVMNQYRTYRKNGLKNYKYQVQLQLQQKTKPTKSEEQELFIKAVKDEFASFKELDRVNSMRNWLYDKFIELGFEIDETRKKIAWKHSVSEIKKEQDGLQKRDKYDPKTLKTKAIILYKSKLIQIIFSKYTTVEQLLNKIQ